MAEGLKLVVTADVSQAEKEIKGFVSTAAAGGEQAGAALGKGLNKGALPAIKQIAPQAKVATQAVSKLGSTLNALKFAVADRRQEIIHTTDINRVLILNGEIHQLNQEIKRIESHGVPTFNKLGTQVSKSGALFQTIVNGANNAFGAIRKIAFILPGIGIAGIFGALFSVFQSATSSADEAAKSVDKVGEAVDAAAEKQKHLADAIDKAAGSVVGEAAKLEDLRKILLATSGAVGQLTQATVNQGLARFIFDEKNVEVQKLLNAQIQKELNLRKQNRPLAFVGQFRFDQEIANIDKQIESFTKLGVATDGLRKKKKELQAQNTQIFDAQDTLEGLNSISDGFDGFFKKFLDGSKETKEKITDITVEAKRLADFLNRNTQFGVFFEVDPQLSEAANRENARKFIEKAKAFFQRNSSEFGTFMFKPRVLAKLDFIGDPKFFRDMQQQAGVEASRTYAEVKKAFEAEIKRRAESDPLVIQTNPKIKAGITQEDLRAKALAAATGIKLPDVGPLGEVLSDVDKKSIAAAQTITGVLTPAFQNLFQAIKAGENPLKAFFDGIGQAVEELIKKLIAAAVQALILSAIFPGGVGGVSGFGNIFKNILGFAGGGIVSGPTLALIGEGVGTNKSNPEVVAPLDQLRGMIAGIVGNNQSGGLLTARIAGNDLLLSNNRSNRSNRRRGAR